MEKTVIRRDLDRMGAAASDALNERIAQLEADRERLVQKVAFHIEQAHQFKLAIQDRDQVLQALRSPVIVTPLMKTH